VRPGGYRGFHIFWRGRIERKLTWAERPSSRYPTMRPMPLALAGPRASSDVEAYACAAAMCVYVERES
jgi:hypothetical protein